MGKSPGGLGFSWFVISHTHTQHTFFIEDIQLSQDTHYLFTYIVGYFLGLMGRGSRGFVAFVVVRRHRKGW